MPASSGGGGALIGRLTLPLALLVITSMACSHTRAPLCDGRYTMGTLLEISLYTGDHAHGERLLESLFAEVERLDALLTTWNEASDVSRLNSRAGHGPHPVDPELARLLARSVEYHHRTRGAFDVTIGPLVSLWAEAADRRKLPLEAEISQTLDRVGTSMLRVGPGSTAELSRAGMRVDLGGIAKGYALDAAVRRLDEAGVENAYLSFGQSSVHAMGKPPGSDGWRVLLRGTGDEFAGVVTLRDQALSVSGTLGQWTEIEGRRFGHILDPRTGHPLARARQAAVVAPHGTAAEAYSKALLVLGESEGLQLLEGIDGVEALLIDDDGTQWQTSGW
ncbi:MAG: FAD:protein FMN transferase, partial [Myxococcota bacterium]